MIKEAREVDKAENDIKNFQSLLNTSVELKNFIKDPTQSINQQNKLINLLADKLNFSKNLKNFLLLLIEKRRIFFVKKIFENFLKLCSQKEVNLKLHLFHQRIFSNRNW